MYYIVSEDGGRILDVMMRMSGEIIRKAANDFGTAVYAIEGQHSGYAASPGSDDGAEDDDADQ